MIERKRGGNGDASREGASGEAEERRPPSLEGGGKGGEEDREEGGGKGGGEGSESEERRSSPDWLEKLVSGVSLLLLLAVIGYLVWEGVGPTRPPSFDATMKRVWQPIGDDGDDYYVLLEVRNEGGRSVQGLGIRAKVVDGQATLAQTSARLSWLPAHSTREVAVILGADPREHTLEVGFEGYEIP